MPHLITRRELLHILGMASAAALLPACGDRSSGAAAEKVIVVGAGFSGLTVANALTAAGLEVEVLEARDRIGGRTWTIDFEGAPVDLGGAWIHGPNGNPVACFATQIGVGWKPAEVIDPTIAAFDPRSGFLSLDDLVQSVALTQAGFAAAAGELRAALGPNANLEQATKLYLDQNGLTGDERPHADFAIRQGIVELFYGGPAELTSLDQIFEDSEFEGGNQFPDGGYASLVNVLASGVRIRLGEVVQEVAYDDQGVRVTTGTGTYRGSHAIVTVPLGVLKSGSIRFTPDLPEAKRNAIARLDMGNFEKVVMRFDRAFWLEPERRTTAYISETYGEFPIYFDLTRFTGQPTLLCFSGGSFARKSASLDDAQVGARVLAILREMFGDGVPPPTRLVRTRWFTDPFALGSYSYIPVGATGDDMDELGAPVGDRLQFAGEATVRAYYGTVAAAMISGLREARRLLGREQIDLLTGPAPFLGCG